MAVTGNILPQIKFVAGIMRPTESIKQKQMKMLLTHDQESTMWHLSETLITPDGHRFYSMPFYMKPLGGGEYERLTFDQLPESAKDMILAQNGIKKTA